MGTTTLMLVLHGVGALDQGRKERLMFQKLWRMITRLSIGSGQLYEKQEVLTLGKKKKMEKKVKAENQTRATKLQNQAKAKAAKAAKAINAANAENQAKTK